MSIVMLYYIKRSCLFPVVRDDGTPEPAIRLCELSPKPVQDGSPLYSIMFYVKYSDKEAVDMIESGAELPCELVAFLEASDNQETPGHARTSQVSSSASPVDGTEVILGSHEAFVSHTLPTCTFYVTNHTCPVDDKIVSGFVEGHSVILEARPKAHRTSCVIDWVFVQLLYCDGSPAPLPGTAPPAAFSMRFFDYQDAQHISEISGPSHPTAMHVSQILLDTELCLMDKKEKQATSPEDLKPVLLSGPMRVRMMPEGSFKAIFLYHLSLVHLKSFAFTGDTSSLEEALDFAQKAVEITSLGQPEKHIHHSHLAQVLFQRFKKVNSFSDLDAAVIHITRAMDSIAKEHTKQPQYLQDIAQFYYHKFLQSKEAESLDRTIHYQAEAVRLCSSKDIRAGPLLLNYGVFLHERYKRSTSDGDLSNAIGALLEAEEKYEEEARVIQICDTLGTLFLERYKRDGQVQQLDNAIAYSLKAACIPQTNDNKKGEYCNSAGVCFIHRYENLGDIEDLELGLHCYENSLQYSQDMNLQHACLSNVGNVYMLKFQRFGETEDIDLAISHHLKALDSAKDSHASEGKPGAYKYNNLGVAYLCKFERYRSIQDLDNAVQYYSKAVELDQTSTSGEPQNLNNLGNSYQYKYQELGDIEDLEKAILYHEKALEWTSINDPARPKRLSNFAGNYHDKFVALKDQNDFKKAIQMSKEALDLTPLANLNKPHYLHNYALYLAEQYFLFKSVEDLTLSMKYEEEAINLLQSGSSYLPFYLHQLGKLYLTQYNLDKDNTILKKCFSIYTRAIHLLPNDHPNYSEYQSDIGDVLMSSENISISELQYALILYKEAAERTASHPMSRFQAALALARIAESLNLQETSLEGYVTAVNLLPLLTWRGATDSKRQNILKSTSHAVHEGARVAIKYQRYDIAIELLENGRYILLNSILELRQDITRLTESYPDHAVKLSTLRTAMEEYHKYNHLGSSVSLPSSSITAEEYRSYSKGWEKLLAEIHMLEGFEDFLKPLSFKHILATVTTTLPLVVINIAEMHSDAIVICKDGVTCVPLPGVNHKICLEWHKEFVKGLHIAMMEEAAEDYATEHFLKPMLRMLWAKVVKPIFKKLSFLNTAQANQPVLPHIWWCPTGPLTMLPLHAAGPYAGNKLGAFDYAISSYTTTISSLTYHSKTVPECVKLLLVHHEERPAYFPELGVLASTVEESKIIQSIVRSRTNNIHVVQLKDSSATTPNVVKELKTSHWLHIACHAEQNTAVPLDSYFALHDKPLKLKEILRENLPNADFAFLSACQTATGLEALVDESLHLSSSLQIAGFRSQIATMWSVKDKETHVLVEEFYKNMLERDIPDSSLAAECLHKAAEELRKRGYPILHWMPFIHMGV